MRMRTSSVAAAILGSLDCFFLLRMSRKRKVILTLEERVSVSRKQTVELLAELLHQNLGVGKTQTIVKEKEDIMKRWEEGERSNVKYCKPRTAGYCDLDKIMWEWFTRARSKNIPVSGKMIQEKALMYAAELGHSELTASNGWLARWQARHNVRMSILSGESGDDVDKSVVEDWSKRLDSVCAGYKLQDYFF